MSLREIPEELETVRARVLQAIAPLTSPNKVNPTLTYTASRTTAGAELPPYYLVYFLLVELLGYRHFGHSEKVAWSIPVDFAGGVYLIEHRKFGLGIFGQVTDRIEDDAREIVTRIQRAVKAARPFFDWLAEQAVSGSRVNVVNNSSPLFERYMFLRDLFRAKAEEAERRKDEEHVESGVLPGGGSWTSVSFPAVRLNAEASWMAMAAVEAFYSWTEHVLIHIAVLRGRITTASEVTKLAEAEWSIKFKTALDIADAVTKGHFDRLLALRQELRNYVAHGAFGKQGEAFHFHSGAGAVPVLLPHRVGTRRFKFGHGLDFNASAAIETIESFRQHIWSGPLAPAEIYIQRTDFPIIMTMAADGTYVHAMRSVEDMQEFVDHISREADRAANMDW